jgi:Uma2 family endonuclease
VSPACIQGAPDLVVEVLSDSSRTIDRFVKRDRYAEFGVPEYSLLDPSEPCIELRRLEAGNTGSWARSGRRIRSSRPPTSLSSMSSS